MFTNAVFCSLIDRRGIFNENDIEELSYGATNPISSVSCLSTLRSFLIQIHLALLLRFSNYCRHVTEYLIPNISLVSTYKVIHVLSDNNYLFFHCKFIVITTFCC